MFLKIFESHIAFNSMTSSVYLKVHTYLNKHEAFTAGLFKYVWLLIGH